MLLGSCTMFREEEREVGREWGEKEKKGKKKEGEKKEIEKQ